MENENQKQVSCKRVLLKLSGEALGGKEGFGLDFKVINEICEILKKITKQGVQIGIVPGGGNFWRGRSSGDMDRVRADQMGMLATVINSLAIADSLEKMSVKNVVQSALFMPQICEQYTNRKALKNLQQGNVVIFSCGTGSPFFSTDSAAALRASEIGADVILKATNTDGVYDSDPKINPRAKRFDSIGYDEILSKNLGIIDSTAASLCRNNKIPCVIFSIKDPKNILRAINGEKIGTVVN